MKFPTVFGLSHGKLHLGSIRFARASIPFGLMWVKQCHKPSPSHHHFYRWYKLYKPFPNGWFMIVFLTLIGYAMAPCFFCLSNAVLISCFSFWYQSSLMFAIVVVPRNLCASPNTSLQTYLRAIIHEVMRSFEQMAWNMC